MAIVLSVFPATGKTYAVEHGVGNYRIIDSDSSKFSWVERVDVNGNTIKVRNPDFPDNYVDHIRENLKRNDLDFIFVSSHTEVRAAMDTAGIPYQIVYPQVDCLAEWIGRMYLRGNDDKFIRFIVANWYPFMAEISPETMRIPNRLWRLKRWEYLEDILTPLAQLITTQG